jgi:hypothetical protein
MKNMSNNTNTLKMQIFHEDGNRALSAVINSAQGVKGEIRSNQNLAAVINAANKGTQTPPTNQQSNGDTNNATNGSK